MSEYFNCARRLFGNSGACSACGQTIPASEFVMKSGGPSSHQPGAPVHVFHLKCFICSKCGSQLVAGDRYYMLAGSLVCEQDWHKLLKSSAATTTVRKGKVGRPRRSRDWILHEQIYILGELPFIIHNTFSNLRRPRISVVDRVRFNRFSGYNLFNRLWKIRFSSKWSYRRLTW